jgi:hypothetical protein
VAGSCEHSNEYSVLIKVGEILTSWATISFLTRTVLCGVSECKVLFHTLLLLSFSHKGKSKSQGKFHLRESDVSGTETYSYIKDRNLVGSDCILSSYNIVTCLTWVLHWQNSPNNNLWFDFCHQRVWKLVKFTEECPKIQQGDNCMNQRKLCEWMERFKVGRTNIDKERARTPSTVTYVAVKE